MNLPDPRLCPGCGMRHPMIELRSVELGNGVYASLCWSCTRRVEHDADPWTRRSYFGDAVAARVTQQRRR